MANFKLAVSNFKFSGKLFIGYLEGKSVLVETGILSLLTSRRRMKRIDLLKIFTESKKAKGEKMNLYRKKMKVMQRVSLESLELLQKLSNYTKL